MWPANVLGWNERATDGVQLEEAAMHTPTHRFRAGAVLASAASTQGCALAAARSTNNGQFTGYVFGAPTIVNNAFVALYPGTIPANTPLILVCRSTTATAATGDRFDRDLSQGIFDGLNHERTSRGLPSLTESAVPPPPPRSTRRCTSRLASR